MVIGIIVLGVIILIVFGMYNSLIGMRNKVKQAESGIDVYLNQRFELIPNLVECVKGYSKHEKDVFENIVKLRTEYMNNKKTNLKQAEELNNNINKIMAVAENYPELKASEQYLNLQKNLTKIESQLQAARRIYNNEVTKYNTKIETVPNNIIAKSFGFKAVDLFTIEEYKKENVEINLGE
jgi:LemA protein